MDPYKAPNAIPLNRPWDQAQAGVALLRQLIEVAHRHQQLGPPTGSAAAPIKAPVADELKKLADLRASGALTDDEFDSLKGRLLNGC